MPDGSELVNLADAMDEQASAVWTWLSLVRGHPDFPGRLGETTLTEFLQAQLWDKWTGQVQYKVPHEPTTGADWEWYVGLPEEDLWVCIRVQAKILSPALTFASIGHHVGEQRQMDILIDAARTTTCRTLPYYVFYVADIPDNHRSPGIRLPLYRWHGMPKRAQREHFGCTAVTADLVQEAYETGYGSRLKPGTYLPFGHPWSELLRGFAHWAAASGHGGGSSAFRSRLRRLLHLLNGVAVPTLQEAQLVEGFSVLADWLSASEQAQPADGSLPEYAAREYLEARSRTRTYRANRTNRLNPAQFRPVRGQPPTFAERTSQFPDPPSVETRAIVRVARLEGAPRLGISFLDLAAEELTQDQ